MSDNPHEPQARRLELEQAEPVGEWPAAPTDYDHFRLPLMNTFLGRVDYCRRLAARQAGIIGFGAGWRAIFVARLGPIFDYDRLQGQPGRKAKRYVLKSLDSVREQLLAINEEPSERPSWVVAILEGELPLYDSPIELYARSIALPVQIGSVQNLKRDFVSLLHELASLYGYTRPLHDPPRLGPDMAAHGDLVGALQGWRLLMATSFGYLFREQSQTTAKKLNEHLVSLLARASDVAHNKDFGAASAWLLILDHRPEFYEHTLGLPASRARQLLYDRQGSHSGYLDLYALFQEPSTSLPSWTVSSHRESTSGRTGKEEGQDPAKVEAQCRPVDLPLLPPDMEDPAATSTRRSMLRSTSARRKVKSLAGPATGEGMASYPPPPTQSHAGPSRHSSASLPSQIGSRPPPTDANRLAARHRDATTNDSRGRADRNVHRDDSATEGLGSSPCMTGYSPSSSDFEPISDSEVVRLNPSAPSPLPPPRLAAQAHPLPSNLSRTLSQRRRSREASYLSTDSAASSRDTSQPLPHTSHAMAASMDDESHRRGIEGDDEDSSAFEDVEGARGRARTRRMRDPELKKSMLEDALRSSLATLLSLAPVQAGLSQTPAMSYASLASLFQPAASTSGSVPRTAPAGSQMGPASMRPQREAPFAGVMLEEGDDVDDEEGVAPGPSHADVFSASSSSASDASGSDAESTTELGVRMPASTRASGSHAIPIGSSRRSLSDSVPSGSAPTAASSRFSPLQSRPVGQPVSDSPPSAWNRSRRGPSGASGLGSGRRRGRGRGGSASPGPASVEERRRARAAAAVAGSTYSAGADWAGSGVRYSEGERSSAERDEAFHDLLSTARYFSDLSPRASRVPFSSLPSSYDSGRTTLPPTSSSTSAWASSAAPFSTGPRSASSSDDGAEDESDPALASESVPTLESLSSGAEGERSPLADPPSTASKTAQEPRSDHRGESHSSERSPESLPEKKQKKGWFSWIRGLGGTVELKVWHLVGICGVLIGAGWAAGALVHALVPGSWIASHLRLAPAATAAVKSTSRYPASSRFASLSTSTSMSELFL
ncbi:hypothetical protein JCM10908_000964 [Rhodotorula pacifica]|uniref:uncharacterized protein n=1 Tax=Rhodotorula pacifica TaxID=1495444 RepID=UPI00317860D5